MILLLLVIVAWWLSLPNYEKTARLHAIPESAVRAAVRAGEATAKSTQFFSVAKGAFDAGREAAMQQMAERPEK